MRINLKVILLQVLPFTLVVLFFWHTLFSYFSQDDFFHLRVVMDKEYEDIPSFFISLQKEYAFYRPLSRETLNLFMYRSFGLNPLPFHVVNLLLIMMNMVLVFLLAKKLTRNSTASYLAVLLYSINSIHSIEMYYLASVQTLIATLFILLSILFYLSASSSKKYLLSLLFFVLGLFSHEISIVLIGIIFFLELTVKNTKIWNKQLVKRLLPFVVIGIFYLANTSLFNRLPEQQVYQPVLSIKSMVNTLSWYTLWLMGVPEFVIDFIGPKLAIDPTLMKWYGSFLKVFLPVFLFSGMSFIFLVFRLRNKLLKDKLIWFILISYFISLSPFLFFPQHKSSYYLTLAACWFALLVALLLSRAWEKQLIPKILAVIIVAAFFIVSYQTTNLNKQTYWAAKRANAASFLMADIKQSYPSVGRGSIFYVKNDPNYPFIAKEWGGSSKQAFYILSGSDAFKLLFKDPTIEVYFEDIESLPLTIDITEDNKVIKYTAKFPY